MQKTSVAASEEQVQGRVFTPVKTKAAKMPSGIPFIIGNEAAERFSYYGMRTILVVFMTKYLMTASGQMDTMSPAQAKTWFHLFSTANYFFPLFGALVADIFWGKYKTIMRLSIVYCLGHLTLAMWETRFGLGVGLTLIAIGSGGIKPCVAAHVGDQFSEKNKSLLDQVFSHFYFAVNFGAFFSTLLTPLLLEKYGPSVAFGIPGLLMLIATIVFYAGRHSFVAMPPVGWQAYKKEVLSPTGLKVMGSLSSIFLFISVFWSLYDQNASAWVLQAEKLDRMVDLRFGPFQYSWLQFELLASQIQAINPVLIMLFVPIFSLVLYPFLSKHIKLTAMRKIGAGFWLTALSFVIVALVENQLSMGLKPSIMWQFWAFVILTMAEVMISITALEFAYTQAPAAMKSLISSFYLLSVSLGNLITAGVNMAIQTPDGHDRLEGAAYYWFFAILMIVAALGFVFVARRYKEQAYLADHNQAVAH